MSQRKCLSCAYFDKNLPLSCAHRDSTHCAGSSKKPFCPKRKSVEEKLSPSLKRLVKEANK